MMQRRRLIGLLAGASSALAIGLRRAAGLGAGADDLLGGVGSGQLPAGAGQRVHRGDRRDGHGGDHALVGLPDQGLHRVQRQGRRLRHGRRRQPVAGRGLDRRALRRPDRLVQASTSSTRSWRRPRSSPTPSTTASTGRSRPRATPPAGPTARTGSRTRPRWRRSRPSTATTSAVPKTYAEMRDIAEFFHRPDENRYGIAHLHRQLL